MLTTTAVNFILVFNSVSPYMEAVALHKRIWNLTGLIMQDMRNDDFWNQKSRNIVFARLGILKYTRPDSSAELLLPHIAEQFIDTFKRRPEEIEYPVYGVLLKYDASITDAIFAHLSSLNQVNEEKKTTVYLCAKLLNNIYCEKIDGNAILINRIQKEIEARPRDKRDALKELLILASRGK